MYDLYDLINSVASIVPSEGYIVGKLSNRTYVYGFFSKKPCVLCLIKRVRSSSWVDIEEYTKLSDSKMLFLENSLKQIGSLAEGILYEGRIIKGCVVAHSSYSCLPVPGCINCNGIFKKNNK